MWERKTDDASLIDSFLRSPKSTATSFILSLARPVFLSSMSRRVLSNEKRRSINGADGFSVSNEERVAKNGCLAERRARIVNGC